MINYRKFAFVLLIVQSLILIFLCATWFKFNKNLVNYGGEIADGIFGLHLILATIYYFSFTVWTYKIYKSQSLKLAGIQLLVIFTFSIIAAIITLVKIYSC